MSQLGKGTVCSILIVVMILLITTACTTHKSVNAVLDDIDRTMWCDTEPVMFSSQDYKYDPELRRMRAKLLIANEKIAGCDDAVFFTKEKIKRYRESL